MSRVLIVEDDSTLANLTAEYLRPQGFEVAIESHGSRANERARAFGPDAVILDIGLPGLDGLSVCRQLRQWYVGPILVLTARGDEADEVAGLEIGADDYVSKPVKPRVLLARLRALLRRHRGHDSALAEAHELRVGPLRVDASRRTVCLGEQLFELTTSEFDLMWFFAQNAGQVLTRDAILQATRGIGYDGLDRSLDLSISRLRKKLAAHAGGGQLIKSVRGVGYILAPPP
ncbi:MAG: response regulator [Nannocystales bacterium]